jgi:hypothetical protein
VNVEPENRTPPGADRCFQAVDFPPRAGKGNYGRLTEDAAAHFVGWPETRPIPRAFYHQERPKKTRAVWIGFQTGRWVLFHPKGRIRPREELSCTSRLAVRYGVANSSI